MPLSVGGAPHLTQCRLGRGLYLRTKWHLHPSNRLCGIQQRAPPIFGRAAITLGIGPHSSIACFLRMVSVTHMLYGALKTSVRTRIQDYCTQRRRRYSQRNHCRLFPNFHCNRLRDVPRCLFLPPVWHLNISIQSTVLRSLTVSLTLYRTKMALPSHNRNLDYALDLPLNFHCYKERSCYPRTKKLVIETVRYPNIQHVLAWTGSLIQGGLDQGPPSNHNVQIPIIYVDLYLTI